ncbi:TetR/AcrR family transcriptional regulator [Glutamicibacter endophyticus]|uniref:TetR/AcrR family transcriptional regulator n=1 Tax=Glutamicibacter endophyticus TaxID=1522174 RepID=UPI003AF0FC39
MIVVENSHRKAGRPRTSVLDRERITQHALELVTASGYEGLTMQRLAKSLGVSPSALYNHVDSKQDLLQWIQESVMTQVDSSSFDTLPLREALGHWATSYRDTFSNHIPLIPVIAVLPVADSPRTLRMYERVARALTEAGLAQEQVVPTIVALESFIFGSAMDTSAPHDIFDAGAHHEETQNFTEAIEAQRRTEVPTSDASFQRGLRALIDGMVP